MKEGEQVKGGKVKKVKANNCVSSDGGIGASESLPLSNVSYGLRVCILCVLFCHIAVPRNTRRSFSSHGRDRMRNDVCDVV